MHKVIVIGGGLAGSEAALTLAAHGVACELYEQRLAAHPAGGTWTPAHTTAHLAELVCSNSFKSDDPVRAQGLLKEELRVLGSQLVRIAGEHSIPGGAALVVDRGSFSRAVTERIEAEPLITLRREQCNDLETLIQAGGTPALQDNRTPAHRDNITIVATGPLTSGALWKQLSGLIGGRSCYFYDATAPIVSVDSVDDGVVFAQSRYGKGGGKDYINCPMDEMEYAAFHAALCEADVAPLSPGDDYRLFEGCLPIEELARRGVDAMRFGPLKPKGLTDPRSGREPYAVVQLRWEDALRQAVSLVGFQTRLRHGEQERVFRMIPGLARARFIRHGRMHRNSYVDAPRVLKPTLQLKKYPRILLAGQITGLEGYVSAIATGLWAGVNAALIASGDDPRVPPEASCLGAMLRYMADHAHKDYTPAAFQFGMHTWLPGRIRRRERQALIRKRAEEAWREMLGLPGLLAK